jgi:hypothetical protein
LGWLKINKSNSRARWRIKLIESNKGFNKPGFPGSEQFHNDDGNKPKLGLGINDYALLHNNLTKKQ